MNERSPVCELPPAGQSGDEEWPGESQDTITPVVLSALGATKL